MMWQSSVFLSGMHSIHYVSFSSNTIMIRVRVWLRLYYPTLEKIEEDSKTSAVKVLHNYGCLAHTSIKPARPDKILHRDVLLNRDWTFQTRKKHLKQWHIISSVWSSSSYESGKSLVYMWLQALSDLQLHYDNGVFGIFYL